MTELDLSFSPLLPWPILAGLAALALAVLGANFLARRRGTLLRALSLFLMLLALAGPAVVREDRAPLRDIAIIAVDRSGSQTIGDRPAQTEAAAEALTKALTELGNVEVKLIESTPADMGNDGTRLFSALSSGLADVPPDRIGGVFLVTDGLVHDPPQVAGALGFKAPLHALITGYEGERDRRIEIIEAPRFGIVGKDLTVELKVVDEKQGAQPMALKVRRDGEPVATLIIAPFETVRVPVRIDHAGQNVIELEVASVEDELSPVNNKAVVSVEGVRDKLKVLLVSGEPHSGERMWRNLLKADPNVDLVHFTILRPPEKQDGTPISELSLIAFPTSDLFGRKIGEFDLIVFDRYSNQSVLPAIYFDNIVRYVRDGGALMLAAGPDFARPEGLYYSPLGRIAPARPDGSLTEQGFFARITDEGARHPVTRGMPGAAAEPPGWSRWFRQVNAEVARGTSILSGADQKPLLVLSREGKGRIALLLSDQMWLWARGFEGGGPHLDLLRRLAHWLMKEPELEEEALRAQANGQIIEIERQSLRTEAPPVTIVAPSGTETGLDLEAAEPGLARGRLEATELGLYRLSDGNLSVLAHVGPENPREFQNLVSTQEILRPIIEASGGTIRRLAASNAETITMPRIAALREAAVFGGKDYAALKRTGASEVLGVGVTPLAIGFLGLAALLGSILSTWFYEGRAR
jgi:hypothetical protein